MIFFVLLFSGFMTLQESLLPPSKPSILPYPEQSFQFSTSSDLKPRLIPSNHRFLRLPLGFLPLDWYSRTVVLTFEVIDSYLRVSCSISLGLYGSRSSLDFV